MSDISSWPAIMADLQFRSIFLVYFAVLGAIVASFVNCLLWRLYQNESIWGRSHCPLCRAQIAWYDNIPLLSWLLLRGRCRRCQGAISIQYPFSELAGAVLFAISFLAWQGAGASIWSLLLYLFCSSAMLAIFISDWRWMIVFDIVVLPAAVLAGLLNYLDGHHWQDLLFSAIIGVGFFLFQFLVSRGKWLGFGDVYIGLLMGFMLASWQLTFLAIMLAYIVGSVIALSLVAIGRKDMGAQIPLGVFLAPSALMIMWWGTSLFDRYFSLIY